MGVEAVDDRGDDLDDGEWEADDSEYGCEGGVGDEVLFGGFSVEFKVEFEVAFDDVAKCHGMCLVLRMNVKVIGRES